MKFINTIKKKKCLTVGNFALRCSTVGNEKWIIFNLKAMINHCIRNDDSWRTLLTVS